MIEKVARWGNLRWILPNQVILKRKISGHTFRLGRNRLKVGIVLKREFDKAGYSIIGYAFNKGALEVTQFTKKGASDATLKCVLGESSQDAYYQKFFKAYSFFLKSRKARFLMNYNRVVRIAKHIPKDFEPAKHFYDQFSGLKALSSFKSLLYNAQNEKTLKCFFSDFKSAVENYSNSTSKVYQHTCRISVAKAQEAMQEIKNYQAKIRRSFQYDFSVEQHSSAAATADQLLFTTSSGVFIYDATNEKYVKILDGKFYGLTKYHNIWIASRSNNKGDRSHIKNNRISDICSFSITSNLEVQDLKVLLYGIPGEIHQIDVANNILYIPHTDFNQVLFIDINTCLNSITPKTIFDCNSFGMDIYPHSHLNSVFILASNLYLISHNFTMKTGKLSDLVVVNLQSLKLHLIPLKAHSAHNIYVNEKEYFFCDSNNKALHKNQFVLFEANKLLRGLSITSENILVGGSDICFNGFKRFSNNPSIYILSRKSGSHLKTIHFSGLGDIYEIRQLNQTDYSLSQNNQ